MASGNLQFKAENGLLVIGNSNCAGDFQISGNLTVGGTQIVTGNVIGSLVPGANVTYFLGNSSLQWAETYSANIVASVMSSGPGFIANTTMAQFQNQTVPSSNNVSLGSSTRRWDFFANNANLTSLGVTGLSNLATVNVSSTLAIGGVTTTAANVSVTGSVNASAALNAGTTLGVTGAATLSNTVAINGALTVTSNVTLKANSTLTSLQLLGNNTTSNVSYTVNNYTVTGLVSFANTLSVTGAANALSTFGVTGATTLANTLAVTGAVTVTSNTTLKANSSLTSLLVQGNNTVSNLTVTVDTITLTGLATVSNTLAVTGLTTLSTANITGQFDARAAANVAGAFGVVGATTLSNTVAVSGAVTVTSNVTLKANSTLTSLQLLGNNTTSNLTFTVNNYTVTGLVSLANTFSVTGAANALSTLGVSGVTSLANLSAGGGSVTVNTTQLTVLNAAISVNTGSKLSIVATGNSTVGNLTLTNDLTTIEGNVSFRSALLFIDSVNNRVGIKNTAPDADLKITGTANISGAVVIGGALLVQGAFTNNAAVDHNATTNYVADQHVAHTGVSITAGSGLTGGGTIAATRTVSVLPNNGISANATGTFAVVANGMVLTSTGINVNPNTGITANSSGTFATVFGKQAIFLPAAALTPRSANGCATLATSNGATAQPDVPYLAFDGAAVEYACFNIIMPKSWDLGTVTAKVAYRRASGTGAANTVWGVRAVAVANNASPAAAFGSNATATSVASTTTANFVFSPETGACTIAGSPTAENLVFFEVFRDGGAAGDTLDAVDAWLTGVTLYITTNAINDA